MADGSMTMTYSAILRDKDNKKVVRVEFKRDGINGPEIAQGLLPDCKIVGQNGYSAEEVEKLEEYLQGNLDELLSKAKVISNPLKWL